MPGGVAGERPMKAVPYADFLKMAFQAATKKPLDLSIQGLFAWAERSLKSEKVGQNC